MTDVAEGALDFRINATVLATETTNDGGYKWRVLSENGERAWTMSSNLNLVRLLRFRNHTLPWHHGSSCFDRRSLEHARHCETSLPEALGDCEKPALL